LLDLMLPDVDGSVVAEHVASMTQKPAVIILSSRPAPALSSKTTITRAFRKPFDVRRLLDTMATLVRGGSDVSLLVAAIAALRADPPKLGAPIEEDAWDRARRVVE